MAQNVDLLGDRVCTEGSKLNKVIRLGPDPVGLVSYEEEEVTGTCVHSGKAT